MTPMLGVSIAVVAIGGAMGAVLRHLVDQGVSRATPGDYPWGILLVNGVGSLLLGLVTPGAAAGAISPPVAMLLGVGVCGALTTYSTVAAQTWQFVEQDRRGRAAVVIVATVLVSAGAAAAGVSLSDAVAAALLR